MFLLIALAGLAAGIFGGMGMGGGTVLIPLLTLLFEVEQRTAQAINLIAFLPMAAAALVFHLKNRLVIYKDILYIILPGLAVGVATALLAHNVPSEVLKKIFGGFLVLLGGYQLICICRNRRVKVKVKGS